MCPVPTMLSSPGPASPPKLRHSQPKDAQQSLDMPRPSQLTHAGSVTKFIITKFTRHKTYKSQSLFIGIEQILRGKRKKNHPGRKLYM
jgi:hypothetical protein